MKSDLLDRLLADRDAKRAVVLVTDLDNGGGELHYPGEGGDGALAEAVAAAARADKSRIIEHEGRRLFLNVNNPPLRMVICGAVHIAQPLSRMATLAGYDVTVVDPRAAFASAERFPGLALSHEWPDEAMEALGPDARTAVVTLTHDPKLDDPALLVTLRSPAFYIGSLGSTRTHAKRKERLSAEGIDEANFARIHGPIGLDIGAKSPAEIAVSIMGEITETLRRKLD